MNRALEQILPRVQKPARYTGGEYNAIVKDRRRVDLRYALCFPDTYEIGMSNLGMRILYGVMNGMEGVWCERVFAPWTDMEEEMRRAGIPLYGLESGDAISGFDIIGFSLGYEMAYTNVLNMLDLAGLPLRSADRPGLTPLVVAGGACAYNPEPLAPFVDLFILGEGEEVTPEYIQLYRQAREECWSKEEFLQEAARIEGIYVPAFYEPVYKEDGALAEMRVVEGSGAPETVRKRIVEDFEHSYFPVRTIVPSTEIVHDRVMLELFRGCIRGCRFCQAGYVYRPVRNRSAHRLAEYGKAACQDSGYQEMTLSSLSSTDYPGLLPLCDELLDYCAPRDIGLSLPSLRADTFSMNLMDRLQRVRKGGLTFAPEAGTQRLRDAINKNLTEADLLQSVRTAFSGGWSGVKLYFMLGLPTETDEDVLGIADLARKVPGSCPSPTPPSSGRGRSPGRSTSAGWTCCGTPSKRSAPSPTTGTTRTPAGWRRCSPGGTGGWPTCWSTPGSTGPKWTPGASTSTFIAGWTPWPPAAWTGTSTPTGSGPGTRCSPGAASTPWSPPPSCGGSGSSATPPRPPRTAAPGAPAAGPIDC